jgi:hypothetical protein
MSSLLIALLLSADATVHLVSKPSGATVMLDTSDAGVTPVDVKVPAGKHQLTVSMREYEPMKRPLKSVKDGETLTFDFVAEKTKQLEGAVTKAQKNYDAAEQRLIKAQESGTGVDAAEAKMSDSVRALDKVERELEEFKKAKGVK